MSLENLVDLIHETNVKLDKSWTDRNQAILDGLARDRYGARAQGSTKLQAPSTTEIPFAAYIHPDNAGSGAYTGMSFVLFPQAGEPSLIGLLVGTNGLGQDHMILGRPGHARSAQAICAWLNASHHGTDLVAWAKHDPTRTDQTIPGSVSVAWSTYKQAIDRYGHVMYAVFRPSTDKEETKRAVIAMLDLYFRERGFNVLAAHGPEAQRITQAWMDRLMPTVEEGDVHRLLAERRFVILQGPPGTGKTRMATRLLAGQYAGNGHSVQFHPNTTYETVIGGLVPVLSGGDHGLRFESKRGALLDAVVAATNNPDRPYLLHIDEINRADLAKVLGEAIFLLEAAADGPREIRLPYSFPEVPEPLGLPKNLHILGTMNSADRSIALVDVAVRRRFGFLSLWPRSSVVQQLGGTLANVAFQQLLQIFVDHAPDEVFPLVPGHSYFLEPHDHKAYESLQVNLIPLLEEYLAQGYVTGFAESIRSYIQWLRAARPEALA
jgi:5-methylcytosine-specific restriction enzyme B